MLRKQRSVVHLQIVARHLINQTTTFELQKKISVAPYPLQLSICLDAKGVGGGTLRVGRPIPSLWHWPNSRRTDFHDGLNVGLRMACEAHSFGNHGIDARIVYGFALQVE